MTSTRHIPPGREALWRRQDEVDAEIARLDAACDAAEHKARELAKVLDPDDSIVEDADEEFARLFDERNRAVAVADAVYRERLAGLTSWIDHDPTAPICPDCQGTGGPPGHDAHGACPTCRGWGREHLEPIPVWNDRDKEWVNPVTGRTVDLLADGNDPPSAAPAAPPKRAPEPPTPTQPTAAPTTGSAGGAMSIDQVRGGIARANEIASQSLGSLQQAYTDMEQAQGLLLQATEGSGQADVQEATGMFAQAIQSISDASQQISGGVQSADDVAARL